MAKVKTLVLTIRGSTADFVLGDHYHFAFSILMPEIISSICRRRTRQDRIAEAHKRYTQKIRPKILLNNAATFTTKASTQP